MCATLALALMPVFAILRLRSQRRHLLAVTGETLGQVRATPASSPAQPQQRDTHHHDDRCGRIYSCIRTLGAPCQHFLVGYPQSHVVEGGSPYLHWRACVNPRIFLSPISPPFPEVEDLPHNPFVKISPTHYIPLALYGPLFPHFPRIFPISPHFPPFSPFFQTPKSCFGELVSSVAVRADACASAARYAHSSPCRISPDAFRQRSDPHPKLHKPPIFVHSQARAAQPTPIRHQSCAMGHSSLGTPGPVCGHESQSHTTRAG